MRCFGQEEDLNKAKPNVKDNQAIAELVRNDD